MCGKEDKAIAATFGENGETVLPGCANSDKCQGKCKGTQIFQEIAENGDRIISLRPTLIINGEEKPFIITYDPID